MVELEENVLPKYLVQEPQRRCPHGGYVLHHGIMLALLHPFVLQTEMGDGRYHVRYLEKMISQTSYGTRRMMFFRSFSVRSICDICPRSVLSLDIDGFTD